MPCHALHTKKMEIREFDDPRIASGMGWIVCGSSGSGKSTFIKNLILHSDYVLQKKPTCYIYVYCLWENHFLELEQAGVRFFKGFDHEELQNLEAFRGGMIVYDDCVEQLQDPLFLRNMFCKYTHHLDLHAVCVVHHMYSKTIPHFREICLNAQITVFLSSPRAIDAICTWARQVFARSSPQFISLYKEICKEPHQYLLTYLAPANPNILRVPSKIFPFEQPTEIYALEEK